VTTNIVGIATAVLGGAGIAVAELGKRVVRR
jgi:hypothetical protein